MRTTKRHISFRFQQMVVFSTDIEHFGFSHEYATEWAVANVPPSSVFPPDFALQVYHALPNPTNPQKVLFLKLIKFCAALGCLPNMTP